MQTLAEAQDTNRRLNRRLGDAEAVLNSGLSQALRQLTEAQLRCDQAQNRWDHFSRHYTGEIERRCHVERSRDKWTLVAAIGWLFAGAELLWLLLLLLAK